MWCHVANAPCGGSLHIGVINDGGVPKERYKGTGSRPKVFALRAAKNEPNLRFVCLRLGLFAAGFNSSAGIGRRPPPPGAGIVAHRVAHRAWTSRWILQRVHCHPPPPSAPHHLPHPPRVLSSLSLWCGGHEVWAGWVGPLVCGPGACHWCALRASVWACACLW